MSEHPENPAILVLSDGETVRAFSSVGCYPVFHVTDDGGVLCAPCVQEEIDQCIDPHSGGWYVTGHDVNWEDPELYCDHCGERIESAYAEIEPGLLTVYCEDSSEGYLLSVSGDRPAVVATVAQMQSTAGASWEVDPFDGFAYCLIASWDLRTAYNEVRSDGVRWAGIRPAS